jgi:hypothetical protein
MALCSDYFRGCLPSGMLTAHRYMKQNWPKIPFYLDEVGNAQLSDVSFQQNFGEALWAVDMQLYAMVQVRFRLFFSVIIY